MKRPRAAPLRVADLGARAVLLVAAGGAIGCVLRYAAGVWLAKPDFPWATLGVNLLGSFAIGLFLFYAVETGTFGTDARLFFVTGVLGGFTTMSAFAFETVALAEARAWLRASSYAALTVVGSLAMAALGRAAAAWLR